LSPSPDSLIPGGINAPNGVAESATKFMRLNLHRVLPMKEAARHVGLAPTNFYRVFRTATGQTPKQVLTRIRLERASELLLRTDFPLKEIGAQVGMPCVRSLNRAFVRWKGCTRRAFGGVTGGNWGLAILAHWATDSRRSYSKKSRNCPLIVFDGAAPVGG
jgi:AraC-like DNA-binding protein